MKRFYIALLVLAFVLGGGWYFYSRELPKREVFMPSLAVDSCAFHVGAEGGRRVIVELIDEESWCASVNGGEETTWAALSLENGEEGKARLTISISANPLETQRSAYVKVVYGNRLHVLLIEQEGYRGKNK